MAHYNLKQIDTVTAHEHLQNSIKGSCMILFQKKLILPKTYSLIPETELRPFKYLVAFFKSRTIS